MDGRTWPRLRTFDLVLRVPIALADSSQAIETAVEPRPYAHAEEHEEWAIYDVKQAVLVAEEVRHPGIRSRRSS
jgi:hypothetical protein